AVSFSYAYPGEFPTVCSVVKWPGQPEASGDSKIPTIIAYQGSEPKFFGAEAREYIDDEEYEIARWFKLRLHPMSMKSGHFSEGLEIPSLPSGVPLLKVYSDFMRYLYKSTRDFFITNTPNGQNIWSRLQDRMPLIFCTPNGWDMSEHSLLTEAAISAGIVPSSDSEERLWFVTEGEASVHYSLAHTKTAEWLKQDTLFAVTDAGGSTVDSTLYRCRSRTPLALEEVCASACVQAGGVFVDRAMQTILENKLKESSYGDSDMIAAMIRQFEQKTKRAFDGTQVSNTIQFGFPRDNDKSHGIIKGKLSLTSDEVGSAYTDVTSSIIDSCKELLGALLVQHLLLVGGFGESPYLKKQIRQAFEKQGTQVVTIDEPSKKAAADGAVIWYLAQLVEGRAARFTCGILGAVRYDNKRHKDHESKCFTNEAGEKRLEVFIVLIPKNTILTNDWRSSWSSQATYNSAPTASKLGKFKDELYTWQGDGPVPYVLNRKGKLPSGLIKSFRIEANLSSLCSSVKSDTSKVSGEPYWVVRYKIDVLFRSMKLMARLRWIENGVERTGPATIIPSVKL
ncbi:hypothetical protein FS842_011453, partial [Serendipita sp. 407]